MTTKLLNVDLPIRTAYIKNILRHVKSTATAVDIKMPLVRKSLVLQKFIVVSVVASRAALLLIQPIFFTSSSNFNTKKHVPSASYRFIK
jgi:hypothetical protein